MASEEWVQVRMRRATYARLREFGARTLKLVESQRLDLPTTPSSKELSADILVSVLLDRDDKGQARNKRRSKS